MKNICSWLLLISAFIVAGPARVEAQARPTPVDVLLVTSDVLHVADVISTSYDLTRGAEFGAVETNPYLKPFARKPVLLGVVSSAIDVAQVAMIKRMERNHPRLAIWWAAALAGVEVWATTNNIVMAGRIHQRQVAASLASAGR